MTLPRPFAALSMLLLAAVAQGQTVTQVLDESGDGLGNPLHNARSVAVDGAGNVFVSNDELFGLNPGVFKLTPEGEVSRIIDGTGDGSGNTLDGIGGVVVDRDGNVFVVGGGTDNVFRITPGGEVTQVLGPAGDGAGNPLDNPIGITTDALGNLYVVGNASDNAFKVTPAGVVTLLIDASGDGAGNVLDTPGGIAVDAAGNVFVGALVSENVFRIEPDGQITEFVDATLGPMLNVGSLAVDGAGDLLLAEVFGSAVFRIRPDGTTTGLIDATGDGAGHALQGVQGLVVDDHDNVYVGGLSSHNVFQVTPAGVITQVLDASGDGAGNPVEGVSGLAVDDAGNLYVSCTTSRNVFRVDLVWTDLGGASPGVAGAPRLTPRGRLEEGDTLEFRLTGAPPDALMLAWISSTSVPLPILGGTLHAQPYDAQLLRLADAGGRLLETVDWPAGMASGMDVYLQFILQDATTPAGLTLSNAVRATTP